MSFFNVIGTFLGAASAAKSLLSDDPDYGEQKERDLDPFTPGSQDEYEAAYYRGAKAYRNQIAAVAPQYLVGKGRHLVDRQYRDEFLQFYGIDENILPPPGRSIPERIKRHVPTQSEKRTEENGEDFDGR
jgi:hypothetical protein